MSSAVPSPVGAAAIAPFVCRTHWGDLAARAPGPPQARITPHVGVAMLVDIVGFSRMTEVLAAKADGAERIRTVLAASLGRLVGTVRDHGGDVLKFAGDALVCFWPADANGLDVVAGRAVRCGLQAQQDALGMPLEEGGHVVLRVCIGSGDLLMLEVGGVDGRWEVLPAGKALSGLGVLRDCTEPAQVVVDADTAGRLGAGFTCVPVPGVAGPMQVLGLEPGLVTPVDAPPPPGDDTAMLARPFISPVVLARLAAGQSEWLCELRTVTVLFAKLPSGPSSAIDLDQVQAVVQAMQRAVSHQGGTVDKICVDEKGAVLIAAFGVPPASHPDDAARAVRAASAIRLAMEGLGHCAQVGVATGPVFCGTVGDAQRGEYTVLGHVVNRAARLMGAARGGVLCDELTTARAKHHVEMARVGELELRGHAGRVVASAPTGTLLAQVRTRSGTVGRVEERTALADCLRRVEEGAESGVVVLVGEAGIGKSCLLDDAEMQATARGFRVVRCRGDAIDRNTPYHAWQKTFADLDAEGPPAELWRRSAADPATSEEAGAQAVLAALAARFLEAVGDSRVLVLAEDVHWMDSASWALLRSLRLAAKRAAWIVASRPMEDPPREYAEMVGEPGVTELVLGPLSRADIAGLAAARLGVTTLPPEVLDLLHARADGNALFAEELVLTLRDSGRLEVVGTEARLAVSRDELSRGDIPATIAGLVMSRVDVLSAPTQLVLKVASVVGRSFAQEVVRDVFPVAGQAHEVSAALPALVDRDLVHAGLELDEFLFRHALTQEAVYGLILFGQRRSLHRAVAEWYERRFTGALDPVLPSLAHHWFCAEEWAQALVRIEAAAEQNLDRFANREAIELLTQALEIDRMGVVLVPETSPEPFLK